MFKKEIKELFKLAWRVSNETDYFVSFYITSHVHLCDIDIMNSKWDPNRKKDGNYTIYFDSKLLKKEWLIVTQKVYRMQYCVLISELTITTFTIRFRKFWRR